MEDGKAGGNAGLGCKLLPLPAAPSTLSVGRFFSRLGASLRAGHRAAAEEEPPHQPQRLCAVGSGVRVWAAAPPPAPLWPVLPCSHHCPRLQNMCPKVPTPWLEPLQSSAWLRG